MSMKTESTQLSVLKPVKDRFAAARDWIVTILVLGHALAFGTGSVYCAETDPLKEATARFGVLTDCEKDLMRNVASGKPVDCAPGNVGSDEPPADVVGNRMPYDLDAARIAWILADPNSKVVSPLGIQV